MSYRFNAILTQILSGSLDIDKTNKKAENNQGSYEEEQT